LKMKSGYAVRLYEIFKRRYYQKDEYDRSNHIWEHGDELDPLKTHTTEWKVSLEELRRLTETENTHSDWRNWNKKVLQPALKEINEKTDINVWIETKLYLGRSINALLFTIKSIDDTYKTLDTLRKREDEMQQSLFGEEVPMTEVVVSEWNEQDG